MIPLCEEKIKRALPHKWKGLGISVLAEIDSTNNEAKRRLKNGEKPAFLVTAECQSAGRGRQGKSFYSPAQAGLYMSLAVNAPEGESAVSLTTMAAVAVCQTVEELAGVKPMIKWVNDLYLDGKKICGILAERTGGAVVIGVGVNVGMVEFPEELRDIAASLHRPELDRNRLAAGISARLMELSADLSDRSYMEKYRERSMVVGSEVEYMDGGEKKHGLALSIDDEGGLVVEHEGKTEILRSGEISLRVKQ